MVLGGDDASVPRVTSAFIERYEEHKDNFYSLPYVLYHIVARSADGGEQFRVHRRYRNFVDLDAYFRMCREYERVQIPILPEKEGIKRFLKSSDQSFLEERKNLLEIYLQEVLAQPVLSQDAQF